MDELKGCITSFLLLIGLLSLGSVGALVENAIKRRRAKR